jgi:hypothetical protein
VRWRRWALRVAAVVAIPLAIAFAVVAVDVLRVPGKLASGDVRFDAAPKKRDAVWSNLDFVRGWPAARLLEVEDDLEYRRTIRTFLRVEPGKVTVYGPELENLRGRAQREITAGSVEDPNRKRRAQYLNFLAAMLLERYGTSQVEADVKLNLELALRTAKAVNLPGTDPDARRDEGDLSGEGRSGSGY